MRAATVACFAALVIAAGGLFVLSGLACDTTIHQPLAGEHDATVTATCLEAVNHSDFEWISENVFEPHCSLSNVCHASNRPAAELNLKKDKARAQLVGVTAISVPDWIRVVPGHPEQSYILVKLGVIDGPLGDGGLMPQGSGGRLLCHEKLDAVRRWIETEGQSDAAVDAGVDAAPDGAGPD